MKKLKNTYSILCLCIILMSACSSKHNNDNHWPITSYNFGGMEQMSAFEQIQILRSSGYEGIILRMAEAKNFEMLPAFLNEAGKYDDFKVSAVFVRYNFNDTLFKERWVEVADAIADKNIQLWVIFGKKLEGINDAFVEGKLREIVDYATPKNVEVILYPHSDCYVESAEEALPFVEKIDVPNLKLAFHLYHEVRAHNGTRIPEVLKTIHHKLGAVTLAGSDSIADYTNALTRDTSTIKALDRGNYDLKEVVENLKALKYDGDVGFMNFNMKGQPAKYLPESLQLWNQLLQSD